MCCWALKWDIEQCVVAPLNRMLSTCGVAPLNRILTTCAATPLSGMLSTCAVAIFKWDAEHMCCCAFSNYLVRVLIIL